MACSICGCAIGHGWATPYPSEEGPFHGMRPCPNSSTLRTGPVDESLRDRAIREEGEELYGPNQACAGIYGRVPLTEPLYTPRTQRSWLARALGRLRR